MERQTYFDGTSYVALSSKSECVQELGILEDIGLTAHEIKQLQKENIELKSRLKIEKAKTQWQQAKYKDEHVLCEKYKMLFDYPYHITITEKNKDNIPIISKEAINKAKEVLNKYTIKN